MKWEKWMKKNEKAIYERMFLADVPENCPAREVSTHTLKVADD
jgi:hypothetical protein